MSYSAWCAPASARVLANPLVGPALVPVLSAILFFGPVPEWAVRSDAVAWLLQLVLVVLGCGIVLPLLGGDIEAGSLAVGLSLAIGSWNWCWTRSRGSRFGCAPAAPRLLRVPLGARLDAAALHDQQVAGSILWCVAELIDLPFLLLVFRRWLRADARDAAQVDAVLEAERLARSALVRTDAPATDRRTRRWPRRRRDAAARSGVADEPWWLTDPQMRGRGRVGTEPSIRLTRQLVHLDDRTGRQRPVQVRKRRPAAVAVLDADRRADRGGVQRQGRAGRQGTGEEWRSSVPGELAGRTSSDETLLRPARRGAAPLSSASRLLPVLRRRTMWNSSGSCGAGSISRR